MNLDLSKESLVEELYPPCSSHKRESYVHKKCDEKKNRE